MKIHLVGAVFFHADRRTDGRGEANSRFFAILLKCRKQWVHCTVWRICCNCWNDKNEFPIFLKNKTYSSWVNCFTLCA